MKSLERSDFVRTNFNRHLAQIKERERLNKMISEINKGDKDRENTDTIQKK
jgi:hypothetical protein